MKKLLSAVLAAALIVCPHTLAYAKDTDSVKSGRTGGVIIEQGASDENYLNKTDSKASSLPKYYSSVDMGYVTSVKDQSIQNTCVFFSSTAAMETALLKNGYGKYDLSEEYANYWASTRQDGTGWQRDRVNAGAFPYTGYGYLTTGGVVAESELPYMSRTESYFEELPQLEPLFYAGGIKYLSGPKLNAEEFKKAIMECGGVTASFSMHTRYVNYDTNAFFCDDELSVEEIASGAHSVFVVGWDDSYSKQNFKAGTRPQNDGAWLIKNSWGNDLDYMWISYEDKYLGNEIFGGNFAVSDIIKNHTCNELLTVDSYGPLYEMTFFDNNDSLVYDATFINVFDFSKKTPVISSVEFSTTAAGSDYTIYYIPTVNGVPTDNTLLWTKLASGTIEYSGIHNIPVKSYKVTDSQGAIGIKLTSYDENTPVSIGCCEWYGSYGTNEFRFLPRTINDRSYINSNNMTINLTDYYRDYGDDIGGNFTIRAVTNVQKGDVTCDGNVSLYDAIQLQKQVVGLTTLGSDIMKYVADIDQNGTVTLFDALLTQKISLGIIA
ncbi:MULTISPECIES: C1 family peptidase [unclassified Ruminococcus]|uniref:C1 family peptidase n=1 Tax=unclassified Ruminococcus TaxID=2608920 RepID=UPI00210ACE19|nr:MULTISPECIES: C1 family peptidase [unclassified Ruminococcus]